MVGNTSAFDSYVTGKADARKILAMIYMYYIYAVRKLTQLLSLFLCFTKKPLWNNTHAYRSFTV